ncbi:hypothetical protein [Glycomyces sp. NPDC048151]|uniref:hypothetical protein n=1 Tax=Glycomyces sp. NPDC048151 TaxID=3364002 RepID=UPI0037223688
MSMRALLRSSAIQEAGPAGLGLTGLMLATYPAMLVAALVPSPAAFTVALVASYATDIILHGRYQDLIVRLRQLRFGISNRFLVRELLVILLVTRLVGSHGLSYRAVLLATLAFVALVAVQVLHGGLTAMVRKSRSLPFASRNIDLSPLGVSDAPPAWLENRAGEKILHTDVPLVAGLLVSSFTLTNTPGYIGVSVTFALAVGYLLALGVWSGPRHRVPSNGKALAWLNRWLAAHQPTVVLSFSGSKEATYQVNMWLETLERMEAERPLVILREMHSMPDLARTDIPVLCVPSAVDIMNMDLSTVRVALYPAHVGKNLHLLRVPTMKHAFIGHGDSDKVASINPFGKAYDELWTAGKAGRDRWARADIGVRDEDIVEVGRPQLDVIDTAPAGGEIPTVLYAPTWENWTDDPGTTSVTVQGERIVKALLAAEPPVRVVYKPHPFTGTRSAKAKAADRRIRALIEDANQRSGAAPTAVVPPPPGQVDDEAAKLQWGDAATSRNAVTTRAEVTAERRTAAEWNTAFWAAQPANRHLVVTGALPNVYDCFNQADGLVSDISSVVSDFIASGKPYAVVDSAGVGEEAFKAANTAVRAAVILDPEVHGLDDLLAAVRDPEHDPLKADRKALKTYLLGPDEPTAQQQFNQAVNELAKRAEERNRAQPGPEAAQPRAAAETAASSEDAAAEPDPGTVETSESSVPEADTAATSAPESRATANSVD